jgi:hypothetical protein
LDWCAAGFARRQLRVDSGATTRHVTSIRHPFGFDDLRRSKFRVRSASHDDKAEDQAGARDARIGHYDMKIRDFHSRIFRNMLVMKRRFFL